MVGRLRSGAPHDGPETWPKSVVELRLLEVRFDIEHLRTILKSFNSKVAELRFQAIHAIDWGAVATMPSSLIDL